MSEKLWVQQYMREPESWKRKEILDQAIAEEGMTPDNELRLKLWEKRYVKQNDREIDTFIRGWVNLNFLESSGKGLFSKNRIEKDKQKILEDWQVALAAEYGETGRQVLYEEFFNLSRLYIKLCEEDKQYNSVLLGLGTMKKEKLVRKIAADVFNAAYNVPNRHNMKEDLALFTKAATEAFYEVYDRDKDMLNGLVRGEKKEE